MIPYTFREQLELQKPYFDKFVQWLWNRLNVKNVILADDEEERRGIDLWAITTKDGRVPIQVKVDFKMSKTGNIVLETVSRMSYDEGEWRPGWTAHLHNTQLLVYICADTDMIRIYRSCDIWSHLVENANQYRSFICMNGDKQTGAFWYSMGVKVPVYQLREILVHKGKVDNLDGGCFNLPTIVEK